MKKLILASAIFLLISQNAYAQSVPYQEDTYSVVPATLPKDAGIEEPKTLPPLEGATLESTDTTGEHAAKQSGYYIYVAGRWVVQTTWRGLKTSTPYLLDGSKWTLGTLKTGFITGFNMVSPVKMPL